MTKEALKQLIKDEITKDPTLYRNVVIPAIAESKVGAVEMISACFSSLNMTMTMPQLKKFAEIDLSRAKPPLIASKWKETGKIYSVADFPEWVIEQLEKNDVSAKELVKKAAMESILWVEHASEWFCLYNGEAYFNKRGYQFLIMSCESRWWMLSCDREKWEEASGVFD